MYYQVALGHLGHDLDCLCQGLVIDSQMLHGIQIKRHSNTTVVHGQDQVLAGGSQHGLIIFNMYAFNYQIKRPLPGAPVPMRAESQPVNVPRCIGKTLRGDTKYHPNLFGETGVAFVDQPPPLQRLRDASQPEARTGCPPDSPQDLLKRSVAAFIIFV